MEDKNSSYDGELSPDMLYGARQIAHFLFGSDDRIALRKVYYLAESNRLPVFRLSRTGLCARRSAIRRWIIEQEAESGSAAA